MEEILTAEQHAWLREHVARGEFPSVAEGARQLIGERIMERSAFDGDDFAWAAPLVDEAVRAVANGEILSPDEHEARMDAHVASMKG